jgi:peroxiredoxin
MAGDIATLLNAALLTTSDTETTLGDLVRGKISLVLFVRQFACAGCSEQVAALLQNMSTLQTLGVEVVIVGCGTREHARAFDERVGATDRGVGLLTDPTLRAQRAAGLTRTFLGVNGPRALFGLARAMLRGHSNGWGGGDFYQQGGVMLLDSRVVDHEARRETRVLYKKAQERLGDLVDIGDLVAIVLATRAREKAPESARV